MTQIPIRNLLIWGVIGVVLVVAFSMLQGPSQTERAPELAYSDFLDHVEQGRVRAVTTDGSMIVVTEEGSAQSRVVYVPQGAMPETVRLLREADARIVTQRPRSGPTLGDILLGLLPMLLLIGAWYFFMRRMLPKPPDDPLRG